MPPQKPESGGMRRSGSESDFVVSADECSKSYRDYRVRKSRLIGMVNWTHVMGTYIPHIFVAGIAILVVQIMHQILRDVSSNVPGMTSGDSVTWEKMLGLLMEMKVEFLEVLHSTVQHAWLNHSSLSTHAKITILGLIVLGWIMRMDNPTYLLSFATFKAPVEWKCSHEQILEMMRRQKCYTDESMDFMKRILDRSGTGQATAWPPGIVQCLKGEATDRSIEGSRKEAETIICDIVDKALKKAKCHPKDIDILVINCSLFSPTPSLCALVVSKFNMRSDIQTYNLSGMGCSASIISIELAKNMLQRKSGLRGGKALVVSTEIITPNLYHGNEKGFLLQNTLFRCGGAAIVLSNKWTDGRRAAYKLLHTVRVQGTDEHSYNCVYETQDKEHHRGVALSKDIVKVAGKCMEKNMTMLGPYVLPLTEQFKVVASLLARFVLKRSAALLENTNRHEFAKKLPVVRPYVPDFKRGIDHFCIHAGGRAVIDGIEKNMRLEPFHSEPSRMTLLNYGNTSSSSIWYELEYIQEMQKSNPLNKGHRIMQVAFGSGFKCNSAVWLKL